MIRVGIVGTNTSHAGVYAGLLNGKDGGSPAVAGARIVGAWSSGKEGLSGHHLNAPDMALRFGFEQIAGDPADLIGSIDLAMIIDDYEGGALHAELARPFLEAGVPTYVDKPMTLGVADAVALFNLAEQSQTPLMTCSALHFAHELKELTDPELGDLSTVFSVGPGDWYNYGIHAVEAAIAVCGPGAESVLQVHSEGRDVTVISHASGPRIVIGTLRDAHYLFHLTAYGTKSVASTKVEDSAGFYANTMQAAIRMAETGTSPTSRESAIEVLAILTAGEESAKTGATVEISDLLAGATR